MWQLIVTMHIVFGASVLFSDVLSTDLQDGSPSGSSSTSSNNTRRYYFHQVRHGNTRSNRTNVSSEEHNPKRDAEIIGEPATPSKMSERLGSFDVSTAASTIKPSTIPSPTDFSNPLLDFSVYLSKPFVFDYRKALSEAVEKAKIEVRESNFNLDESRFEFSDDIRNPYSLSEPLKPDDLQVELFGPDANRATRSEKLIKKPAPDRTTTTAVPPRRPAVLSVAALLGTQRRSSRWERLPRPPTTPTTTPTTSATLSSTTSLPIGFAFFEALRDRNNSRPYSEAFSSPATALKPYRRQTTSAARTATPTTTTTTSTTTTVPPSTTRANYNDNYKVYYVNTNVTHTVPNVAANVNAELQTNNLNTEDVAYDVYEKSEDDLSAESITQNANSLVTERNPPADQSMQSTRNDTKYEYRLIKTYSGTYQDDGHQQNSEPFSRLKILEDQRVTTDVPYVFEAQRLNSETTAVPASIWPNSKPRTASRTKLLLEELFSETGNKQRQIRIKDAAIDADDEFPRSRRQLDLSEERYDDRRRDVEVFKTKPRPKPRPTKKNIPKPMTPMTTVAPVELRYFQ